MLMDSFDQLYNQYLNESENFLAEVSNVAQSSDLADNIITRIHQDAIIATFVDSLTTAIENVQEYLTNEVDSQDENISKLKELDTLRDKNIMSNEEYNGLKQAFRKSSPYAIDKKVNIPQSRLVKQEENVLQNAAFSEDEDNE